MQESGSKFYANFAPEYAAALLVFASTRKRCYAILPPIRLARSWEVGGM